MKTHKYIREHAFEIIALLLYAGTLLFVMSYHEPWFDEAQAWLIARDATILDIFTSITHYEGHPPVWFLILMPFAKLGVPYEIGIKSVSFIFSTAAMAVFIFRAPFNRFIRCTVPFTYFFFYQYAVISRPYCLMMLGFMLSAMLYKDRNKKPLRFILALLLICSASAYGMVIAAGIALVWLYEILGQPFSLEKLKEFPRDRRFFALSILLVCNVILLILIYPYDDTFATNAFARGMGLSTILLVAPAEATLLDTFGLSQVNFYLALVASLTLTAFIYYVLYALAKAFRKRLFLFVPYLMLIAFGSVMYFSWHHIGLIAMFYVFFCWCCFDENPEQVRRLKTLDHESFYPIERFLLRAGCVLAYAAIIVSIYFSVAAAVTDVSGNFSASTEAAAFISDNNLDERNIMAAWLESADPESGETYQDYSNCTGVSIEPYFDKNIFYNFNGQQDNECYMSNKVNRNSLSTQTLIENNYPDVLVGLVDLTSPSESEFTYVFGSEIDLNDFTLVAVIPENTIWKGSIGKSVQVIYLRNDLLDEYPQLSEVSL